MAGRVSEVLHAPPPLRAAGRGQGLTQERQALWGWRTVMGRALRRTSTASSPTPLPPDLELILCLVWALISLPPKWVWKIPSLRLPREGALCHSLLQPSSPLRPPSGGVKERGGGRREQGPPQQVLLCACFGLHTGAGAGKAAAPPPLLSQVLAVAGIGLRWEGLPKQLPQSPFLRWFQMHLTLTVRGGQSGPPPSFRTLCCRLPTPAPLPSGSHQSPPARVRKVRPSPWPVDVRVGVDAV